MLPILRLVVATPDRTPLVERHSKSAFAEVVNSALASYKVMGRVLIGVMAHQEMPNLGA